jgi:hypothetical protein
MSNIILRVNGSTDFTVHQGGSGGSCSAHSPGDQDVQ